MQLATRTIRLAAALATLVAATAPTHAQSDRPAALLTYPYVAVDTSSGLDTTLHLSNTSNSAATAHCFYENANAHCSDQPTQVCSTDAACNRGVCTPGWSVTDFLVHLTKLQPIAWRASTGCATAQCSNPAVPELPFVGSMTCVVVDSEGTMPLANNALTGGATLEAYDAAGGTLDVARYNAVGAPATLQNDGDQTLVLGGQAAEYESCPNINILNHFFDGAADPISGTQDLFTILVLLPCSRNPQPGHALVQLQVFNEFEQQFGAFVDVSGLLAKRLSAIAPQAFDAAVVGTLSGQTRIRGTDSGVVALAIEEHQDRADSSRITRAAMNLHTQGTRFQPDYIGPKPALCGDGVVDPGEGCDDGNTQGGDCCSPSCQPEASSQTCSDDGNACTLDMCDGQGTCMHLAADPPPAGCGCCQVVTSSLAPHPCVGDCDGDGVVTSLEVQICQDTYAGRPTADCLLSCDAQGDFDVSAADLAIVTENHLHGCSAGPNVCFAPADAQACGAASGTVVLGLTCDPTRAGADAFGCVSATPADQMTITGTCRRPGQQGLEACPAGTPITISKCTDAGCGMLEQVAAGVTDAQGRFTFALDPALVANLRLIVEALVEDSGGRAAGGGYGAAATRVRGITFGSLAGTVRQVSLGPLSEAAVQLLEQNGLQNYTDARVQGVVDAVAAANQGNTFAGLSVAAAVTLAKNTASADPTVQARLACAIDCNTDGTVTVDELITSVNIALGLAPPASCLAADSNGDAQVTVDEIVDGERRARTGCPTGAMP